jgi:hypothetical protein
VGQHKVAAGFWGRCWIRFTSENHKCGASGYIQHDEAGKQGKEEFVHVESLKEKII